MAVRAISSQDKQLPNTFGLWSGISIGGAYHYAVFLTPEKYRRQIAYPLGWLNYAGWVLTHAACCAVTATLTLALINLCDVEFDIINLFGLREIPTLENVGCWATAIGFVAFSVLLLVKAPKPSASFVLVETRNDIGYSSTALAVLLGLMNSFSTLMGLDSPAHLAEEIPQPKRFLPRIMILILGFSITDIDAVIATSTGYVPRPIFAYLMRADVSRSVQVIELGRLATGSRVTAIVFCCTLLFNMIGLSLGSAITMSRRGFAFARDNGLFWNESLLTYLSPRTNLPTWSINLSSAIVAVIGLIYLFSLTAFNAIIGAQVVCQIISFVVIVAFIPQTHPVTAVTMNYTILIMGCLAAAMATGWLLEGHTKFSPPTHDETSLDVQVIEGVEEVMGNMKASGQVNVCKTDTL
ncbi:choline transporter protein [Fusarium bulbicola]|nr:choline transporter protein [Fusarium bulbicola]